MTVRELGHLVLYVRDVGRSAAFYRDVLGWRQILPEPGQDPVGAAAFSSGRTHHELLLIEVGADATPIPTGRRVGMYHFGLNVGDNDNDLRAALAKVQAAGATVVGASDHTVTHSLYILDPAAAVLRAGGVVVIPTDTVYGLAARPADADAVGTVYRIKGRPEGMPLPV